MRKFAPIAALVAVLLSSSFAEAGCLKNLRARLQSVRVLQPVRSVVREVQPVRTVVSSSFQKVRAVVAPRNCPTGTCPLND